MEEISRRACLKKLGSFAALNGIVVPSIAAPEDETQPSANEIAAIREIAARFMAAYNVPGLSLAIARRGEFVHRAGFGVADKAAGEPVSTSHYFRIASVSKPITSVAIHTFVERGAVSLDQPVFAAAGPLEAGFGKVANAFAKKLTIQHLLTHTCGAWPSGENDPMFLNPEMDHRRLIEWTLTNQPLRSSPGKEFAYSNFGYCLLGRVLEVIGGKSYIDVVRKEVFAQCEVEKARLAGSRLSERAPDEVVYYGAAGEDPYGMNMRRMDSHGGWLATPAELVRFASHIDGLHNILQPATIKLMLMPSSANPNYASGWCVNNAGNWWHNGSLPGTTALLVRTASGLCWAACTNSRSEGIDLALDQAMWQAAKAVPSWHA